MTTRKISLITGINGFVGKYLVTELQNHCPDWDLVGMQRSEDRNSYKPIAGKIPIYELDIRDTIPTKTLLTQIQPDYVFHLAAQSFVPKAFMDPWGTLDINVKGTLNILEGLKELKKNVRMVYVSSADVYGKQDPINIPFTENLTPQPMNPYSASKLAAEIYCKQYSISFPHLEIIIARPFNHIGVGQRLEFVVPNFCMQIVQSIQKGKDSIEVGNINAKRDFLDVRDVVYAYRILSEKGKAGEVYNICSSKSIAISDLLKEIIRISGKDFQISVNPERFRPIDMPELVGDNHKLKSLGWNPRYPIENSLQEIYQWLNSLGSSGIEG